jgi:thioredoxin
VVATHNTIDGDGGRGFGGARDGPTALRETTDDGHIRNRGAQGHASLRVLLEAECGRPFLLDRPIKVGGEDLDGMVRESDVPILVDFYADWCGPCKIMAPVLDALASDRVGEILVAKIDTDANPRVSGSLGIRGIPTLILFRGGSEVARKTGAVPRNVLEEMLGE